MRVTQQHAQRQAAAEGHGASPLLVSQRGASLGPSNQGLQRTLQTKPTVNRPGDSYEQEADRVAASVMSGGLPNVQRVCKECEEEMQRKAGPGADVDLSGFEHPTGGGRPLPDSERSFFEPRFGRDFSGVRIHAESQAAAQAASSVNALAYTMNNDVVFGKGQYQPGTSSGRSLLAHELTHVVQQGAAAETPNVQRLGDLTQVPAMACDVANSSPGDPLQVVAIFGINSSALTQEAIDNLDAFVGTWQGAGADRRVRVDGFSSTDGPDRQNWTLSCNRAEAVTRELTNPTSGVIGIDPAFIETLAQGETDEFSNDVGGNRRALVTSDVSSPPACAAPGVSRSLDLQPIFLRTDPADAAPTGNSWTSRFNTSNTVWNKLGVTFVELAPVTIDTPLKTAGNNNAERDQVAALRTGAGIEVFLVENDMVFAGGASTTALVRGPGCSDIGKIVMSDLGTSDTLLAHELGHTLGLDHPGTGVNPGEADTIMTPSNSNSTLNPTRNTQTNFAAILCPPPTGSVCLNPDP
jgi:outer membrane protein OmpA-like peptidoglycan-associated protein